jgi:alginate O-acetyltransferase complex protein AlgJ
MLFRHRRLFAVLVFLLIATPFVVGLVAPDSPATVFAEGRLLAPRPGPPKGWADWFALPKETDAFLKDHFGLRHVMIRAHRDLTKPMLGFGGSMILVGRDGRLFYLGDDLVRQSAGLVVRDREVADTADTLAGLRDFLEKRGARFLVAVPPNSATVYQDDLPIWAQSHGRRTEYDLFLDDLAARGIKTVDLRPVMAAARAKGEAYFMYDSHWTSPAAIAGFNAVAEAAGHKDWAIDPQTALGPPTLRKTNDFGRMLGDPNLVEETRELALPVGRTEALLSPPPMPDRVVSSGRPGPTVMVIGDSFTADLFTDMLLQHAGRVVWLNHQRCGFDRKWLETYRPDEVWWMPTERFLTCNPRSNRAEMAG